MWIAWSLARASSMASWVSEGVMRFAPVVCRQDRAWLLEIQLVRSHVHQMRARLWFVQRTCARLWYGRAPLRAEERGKRLEAASTAAAISPHQLRHLLVQEPRMVLDVPGVVFEDHPQRLFAALFVQAFAVEERVVG